MLAAGVKKVRQDDREAQDDEEGEAELAEDARGSAKQARRTKNGETKPSDAESQLKALRAAANRR